MKLLTTKAYVFAVIFLMTVLLVVAKLDNSNVQGKELAKLEACKNCQTEAISNDQSKISFTPKWVIIEEAGIDLEVVSVPLSEGTWKVYPHVANYAEGTSLVTESNGNVGIYGHALPDAFLNIKVLKEGDTIRVLGDDHEAYYIVELSDRITPASVEAFYPSDDPILTLITCDGSYDEFRYRVKARLDRIVAK